MTFTNASRYANDQVIVTSLASEVNSDSDSEATIPVAMAVPVDVDNEAHVFPPLSENEIDILTTWESKCSLNTVSSLTSAQSLNLLMQVLWSKIKEKTDPGEGVAISMVERLNNFGFTLVDGTIYKNPFSELACLLFIRNQVIDQGVESEITRIDNLVGMKIKKLFQYLNFI